MGPNKLRLFGSLMALVLKGPAWMFEPIPHANGTLLTCLEERIDFLDFSCFEIWDHELSGISSQFLGVDPLWLRFSGNRQMKEQVFASALDPLNFSSPS